MKNFVQPGNVITLPTGTGGAKSGDGFLFGSLFGVVAADAGPTEDVEVQVVGVFSLPKTGDDIEQGAKVYWDGTACTISGGTLIGAATEAAPASAPTVNVRLNGVTI